MMASTHALIGAVSFAGISALCGNLQELPIEAATVTAATLAALLPDVDTPRSRVGWCVAPLSRWLERRFGHRTLTHSLLGTVLFALLAAPLLCFPVTRSLYLPALIGYFSHLLADAATKSGVPLAWPARSRWVFPGHERYRVKTGSGGEIGVAVVFLVLGVLLVPLAQSGPRRLLHLATGSLPGAVRDVEDMGRDFQLFARVDGYDVQTQKIVRGDFAVVGRRDDGALVVEAADSALPGGYKLLQKSGSELDRITPRRVTILQGQPRRDKTVSLQVANLTFARLNREILRALPQRDEGYAPTETAPDEQWRNARFLHEVLLSGAGVCHAFPQDPQFAPSNAPQLGLKTVVFTGQNVNFDFAQPAHLIRAGTRVALRQAALSVSLPQRTEIPDLNFPLVRREILCQNMRRQSDLRVRVGDLVRSGQSLQNTFAQSPEHEPTTQQREAERRAEAARQQLKNLEREERALKNRAPATWATLLSNYRARRAALESQAAYTPPQFQTAPLPTAQTAPFDAIVERIEWEPPTIPTRKGEVAQHSARLSLIKIAT